MPAILPYFWNIFSTSVFTNWKVLRLPTNTLQTRTIETAPHGYHLTCCSQPGGPGCSSDYQLWSSTWWAQLEWWLILQQKLNAPRSRLYKDSWETIRQPQVLIICTSKTSIHKSRLPTGDWRLQLWVAVFCCYREGGQQGESSACGGAAFYLLFITSLSFPNVYTDYGNLIERVRDKMTQNQPKLSIYNCLKSFLLIPPIDVGSKSPKWNYLDFLFLSIALQLHIKGWLMNNL